MRCNKLPITGEVFATGLNLIVEQSALAAMSHRDGTLFPFNSLTRLPIPGFTIPGTPTINRVTIQNNRPNKSEKSIQLGGGASPIGATPGVLGAQR